MATRCTPELKEDEMPTISDVQTILHPYRKIISVAPFLLFTLEALLASFCSLSSYTHDPLLQHMFRQLLAVNTTFAGMLHFHAPLREFYLSMIFLPAQDLWLYGTGIWLIFSGMALVFDSTQQYAAYALIFIFVAMWPGNIYCIFNAHARKLVCGSSLPAAVIRAPIQIPFITWAYWYTQPISSIAAFLT